MNTPPPFTHFFDLASLAEAEKSIELHPSQSERAAIATWTGVDSIDAFEATVRLRRSGVDHYIYDGAFAADITQSCVVTLAPVRSHLGGEVKRLFRVAIAPRRHGSGAMTFNVEDASDDEETLTESAIDLARPVLEEFVLTIDPYPRVPGATFESPADAELPPTPFAMLERLKTKT
jgi:hypothetical protein